MSHPDVFPLALLVPLLVTASLPAGSVVLASAWAPVAIAGGLALEYNLVDPRTVPAFGLLAIPGLILRLRTALKYPKHLLRRRLVIAIVLAVVYLSADLTVYALRGNLGFTMGDPSRHASYTLTLLTTGKPPVFYDTLRQEYRPVHYPSGLGHAAIMESIVSYLYNPRDLGEASSWQVQFGSVLLELIEYHLNAALITSSIVDLLLITYGRLPIVVVFPLACTIYLACTEQYAEFVPFFQSLATFAASAIALILNSRLLSGLLALSAVVIHFYSIIIAAMLVFVLLWSKKIKTIIPMLVGITIGGAIQYPYVHWSVMTYLPRYPAHPNHLPPDRIFGPLGCFLQFLLTAFVAYPTILFPTISDLPYILPFAIVTALIIIRARKLLPSTLKMTWITFIITILILTAISGSIVGGRLLILVPLLTTVSLALLSTSGYISALGAMYGYCALTAYWWSIATMHGGGIGVPPVWILKEHWKIFHESLCSREVTATIPEGFLPFTCTWKPREIAYIIRTFPEPYTYILLTVKKGSDMLLYVPPVSSEGEYIVKKLPPPGYVWEAGNRAGSLRRNVLISAERYDRRVILHVLIVNYCWVSTPVIDIDGELRGNSVMLSTLKFPDLSMPNLLAKTHRIPGGFLVRISYSQGVRVVKVTISGARWVGGKLVFRGSLRDLVASVRVTGDLV